MSSVSSVSSSSKLVSESATLPLLSTALRVSAKGGIARVVLEQTFENRHLDPLSVTYVFPLPADAAVSGFSFRIGDRTIHGAVDRKEVARERYEDAIAKGQTAALLEQERSSLFTQEIGNVPPGARVVCEIVLDQRLCWLDEGSWEFRFPLAAAPRYLGEAGRVVDASKIAFDVTTALRPRASLALAIGDTVVAGRSPESASHPLQCTAKRNGFEVELGAGNRVELDRDVVVRWPVAALAPTLEALAETVNGKAHALFTIVPPHREAKTAAVARDLVVLLDTSGSMNGAPLDQARRVTMALVDGLGDRDSIELIEFSNQPRRMWKEPIWATQANKAHAMTWLAALRASGGTEMREGILEALREIRADAQRQVVLITDGLIGFEREIVETILERLPAGSRVHTVGVGSSVNRSLTAPAARAGKGIEIVIGLGEDPERAVARIRARTEAPLVVDVTVEGAAILETAPARMPDLYAGAPVLASAKVRPEGGEVVVRGRTATGTWEQRVRIAPTEETRSVAAALFGREAVEDAETQLAAGGERHVIDRKVEAIGIEYQIATRMTSWVAIDETPSVDPLAPTRKEVVPQMLPYGMSVDGLGLRASAHGVASTGLGAIMPQSIARAYGGAPPPAAMGRPAAPPAAAPSPQRGERIGSDDEDRVRAPAKKEASAPRVVFPTKITKRVGREITIEITVTAELAWDPASFTHVLFSDGTEGKAEVDLTKTTRAATLGGNQIARIVIVLDEDDEGRIAQIVFARQAFAVT